MDMRKPLERIGDVRAQADDHRRDQIAKRGLFALLPDRDRRHRRHAGFGQLALVEQIAPQPAADDRQNCVIDRRARHRVLDGTDARKRKRNPVPHPVRRHRRIEPRFRRHARARDREIAFPEFVCEARDAGHATCDGFEIFLRLAQRVEIAADEQIGDPRLRVGLPLDLVVAVRLVGRQIVHRRRHFDTGHTVDRGMMDFGHQRKAAFGQPLDIIEALDDDEFPQWFRQVHRARVQPRDLNAELTPVAGRGKRDVAHVVFEVEIGVLDPVRMVDVERDAHQPLAERTRAAQPTFDE